MINQFSLSYFPPQVKSYLKVKGCLPKKTAEFLLVKVVKVPNKIENIDGNIVIDVESDFKESLARKNANKNIYSQINIYCL